MRSPQPLQQHTSSMFLRSLSALSFFACSISIATAASIPPTVAMRTADLRVRAPPAAPAAADVIDPSVRYQTPSIQIPIAFRFQMWITERASPDMYMSIGGHDITCHPDAIHQEGVSENYVSIELGEITYFYKGDRDNLPRRPATSRTASIKKTAIETLVQMMTDFCKVHPSAHAVGPSTAGAQDLDSADAFMNLLLSGLYSFLVPTEVLEKYKEAALKHRKMMMQSTEVDFQYLGEGNHSLRLKPNLNIMNHADIVLNAYTGSLKHRLSRNIDMHIGNHRISKLSEYSDELATRIQTMELHQSNAPGPNRKRIGFALFYGNSEETLNEIISSTRSLPTVSAPIIVPLDTTPSSVPFPSPCAFAFAKHSEKSRSETELDLADMFINLSLTGKHSVFVQTDVLGRYKTGSIKFGEKIMKPQTFQYLDIVLNVHPDPSQTSITRNIDMNIGEHRVISAPGCNARFPPTTPLQPSNAPGPGRKRIGFAIFSGDSRTILARVLGKITHPEPTARIYEQRRYLEEFSLNLKSQSDVKLDGIVVENLELALGIYKD
ncbi:hypothetical protein EV360DRAFT_81280 [Lentinula raphanica]|nr:hypothetical protein EV360DRAFT_81280 [Lentinula raphanica]